MYDRGCSCGNPAQFSNRRQQLTSVAISTAVHLALMCLFFLGKQQQRSDQEDPIGPQDARVSAARVRLGNFNLGGLGPQTSPVVPSDEVAPELPAPIPAPYKQQGDDLINIDEDGDIEIEGVEALKLKDVEQPDAEQVLSAVEEWHERRKQRTRQRGFSKGPQRASQQSLSGQEFIAAFCAAYRAIQYARDGTEEPVSAIPAHVAERVAQLKQTNYTGKVMSALYNALPFVPPVRLLRGMYYNKKIPIEIVLDRQGKVISISPERLSGVPEVDQSIRHLFDITNFPPIPHYLNKSEFTLTLYFWVSLDPRHDHYYLRAAN